MIGRTIGPYEVRDKLGEGGMGEVYRARDAKLGRDVALKLLPAAFASDPERLARFHREAQVLASLNHPHIAQIYGFEDSGSERALVMELVDGPTLADLIATGPLDVTEALRVARQIALALEAAHDRGITHRDLKPANVKVGADGSVKVLDFGLAKLSSPSDTISRSAVDVTASPTLMSPTLATSVGVILGTAAYMSPEQARGRAVDKRADIWAFGCVLYEMLTGRRAFEGQDVSDTLAAILRAEPDWSLLPSSVTPTTRQYIKRCLAKDPDQRVRDIADVRLALEGAFDIPIAFASTESARRPLRWAWIVGAIAVTATVSALFGVLAAPRLFPAAAPKPIRLNLVPSSGLPLVASQLDSDVAISRDGSRVAYMNLEEGRLALYVRALDRPDVLRIDGVGSARAPFFSADGEYVGFFDGANLKRVSASGGAAVTITVVQGAGLGGSWGDDHSIVYSTTLSHGLMRIPDGGGTPTRITTAGDGERHALPEVLPGGRAVVFTRMPEGLRGGGELAVVDVASGAVKTLVSGTQGRYASSGHLVYAFSGTLRAIGFDIQTLTTRGAAVPVVDRVITKLTGAANFSLSENGALVYESGDASGSSERNLVWVDRAGREEIIPAEKKAYVYPRISPDGKRVALDVRDQDSDLWVLDLGRHTLQRLTFDPGLNRGAVWTPDGKRLIFSGEVGGIESLFWQDADGSGKPEQLTTAPPGQAQVPYSITPDGLQVLYGQPGQPPFDLYALRLDATHTQTTVLNAAYNEHNAEISPNGRWLAYQSDESGANEIHVRRFPQLDSRSQVSSGGGTRPVWARSGRELFYMKNDGTIVAVPIERSDDTTFLAGEAKPLFTGQYHAVQAGRTYDVSPDGKRFLMIKDASSSSSSRPQLVVVLNWFEDLKRLVPIK